MFLRQKLVKGDIVIVKAGEQIPRRRRSDRGARPVWMKAPSPANPRPVVREAGGDRSAVTGGTRVLSDWIVVRITSEPGQSFLDKMIAMVEGAARKKTPNEIALEIFSGCLVYYIYSCGYGPVRLFPFLCQTAGRGQSHIHNLSGGAAGLSGAHHYRRSAFCNRHRGNEPSESGKRTGYERPCIEAAGDVDTLLLDKTGTITLGNRQAAEFIPVDGHTAQELADAAQLASLPDETPEGRSVVILAKEKFGIRERNLSETIWNSFLSPQKQG